MTQRKSRVAPPHRPRPLARRQGEIFQKIREIDRLLRERSLLKDRVFEVYPEVAFWKLNSECVLELEEDACWSRGNLCLFSGEPASVINC